MPPRSKTPIESTITIHQVKQTVQVRVNNHTLLWCEVWGEKALELQEKLVDIMRQYKATEYIEENRI